MYARIITIAAFMLAFMFISILPVSAACASCSAKTISLEKNVILFADAGSNSVNGSPGILNNTDDNGINVRQRTNTGDMVQSIKEIVSQARIGERISGVLRQVAPVIAKRMNQTVFELNRTDVIRIANDVKMRIKPVTSEMEHIVVDGIPMIVKEIVNPAVEISMTMIKNGSSFIKNMTIRKKNNKNAINLTVDGVTAETDSEVIYENGSIFISKLNISIELKTLPDKIKENVRARISNTTKVKEMMIIRVNEKLKYQVKTTAKKKIFGIFDADVDEETQVDADTGEIESTQGPWWGFMAW